MTRRFNVAGPCRPEWHYMLPAASRLPEARALVEDNAYFVVHAPRQTGKTTTLMSLAAELTESGRYAAIHFSCEVGEVAGDDAAKAQRIILSAIRRQAENGLPPELRPPDLALARLGLSRGTLLIFDARTPAKKPGQRPRARRVRLQDTKTRHGRAVRVMWA